MRLLSAALSTVALALSAGCAQNPSTSAMGAGAGPLTWCRDGARVPSSVGCSMHGGVEREAPRAPAQTY